MTFDGVLAESLSVRNEVRPGTTLAGTTTSRALATGCSARLPLCADKEILDIGCNMGVVAYEISKLRPSSIHGIDIAKPHIETAKMLLRGSPVHARFDRLNLGSRRLGNILLPKYDIVLLLAVYQHMQRNIGPGKARRVLSNIVRRTSNVVARVPPGTDGEFIETLADEGCTRHLPSPQQSCVRLSSFLRTRRGR
ncbi:class I SAM-dependent methyltransferase [Mesorhizobium sp. M0500]|uniref:class I SAM-dependent methyltransferase n=1 Tax=unclassified Mesorhizobium TaxID=325217 RepID=UPI0033356552